MQSEGTAQDADAKHVAEECIQMRDVNLLELLTPEVSDLGKHGDHPLHPDKSLVSRGVIGSGAERRPHV